LEPALERSERVKFFGFAFWLRLCRAVVKGFGFPPLPQFLRVSKVLLFGCGYAAIPYAFEVADSIARRLAVARRFCYFFMKLLAHVLEFWSLD
jgi:hypothetical protein